MEELIWNGLDAGGPSVIVKFDVHDLRAVRQIQVTDRGTGIRPDQLDQTFGTVGNSLKVKQKVNSDQRILHGKEGRGRFKALSLGAKATWQTTFKDDGKLWTYDIAVTRDDLDHFTTTDPVETANGKTGTTVTIENVDQGELLLLDDRAREAITEKFAFYLRKYPNAVLEYHNRRIDPSAVIERSIDMQLDVDSLGREPAVLSVIEWKFRVEHKKLFLCDDEGFAWHELKAAVPGRGIEFTSYLCSEEMVGWHQSGELSAAELLPAIADLVEVARDRLREYLADRHAEDSVDLVTQWKEEEIYPYTDAETSEPLKQAERRVFDIVALRVNEHHKAFRNSDVEQKKLTLHLIKQALESNPSSLTVILRDVVKLPAQDQDEFAELLKRTPLTNLIRAGKVVADRLDTIQAFDHFLFDKDWKAKLLERTQLHRFLAHQLWILGEEYTLDTDDESLREVLRKHLKKLDPTRTELAKDVDVSLINGKDGIPDLMLSRRFNLSKNRFEHLVIELKRPSLTLGSKEITQIKDYAFTVATDQRFDTTKVQWTFVLLGNEFDTFAKKEASGKGLPEGCIHRDAEGNLDIWIRTWADVLAEARQRYDFFREKLEVEASSEAGIKLLKAKYPHLFEGKGSSKKADKAKTAKAKDN